MDAKGMTQPQLDRLILWLSLLFMGFFVGYAVANKRNAMELASLPPILVEPGDCIELNDGREPMPRRHYPREIVGATRR